MTSSIAHGPGPSRGSPPASVLILAPQPYYSDRGTPIAVRMVARALCELGLQVDVLTYPIGEGLPSDRARIVRCRNPLRIRSVPVGFSLRKVALDLSLATELRRCLRENGYGAIHAVEEGAAIALLAGGGSTPIVYDMQSSIPEQLSTHPIFGGAGLQAALRRAEAWMVRSADYVAASSGLASILEEHARIGFAEWVFPREPHDVDPARVAELRKRLSVPEGSSVVLYTGTFEPYQGLEALVSALSMLARVRSDFVLVLVGEGRSSGTKRQAATRHDALRVVRRQSRDELPVYLAMADVLVSPRAHGRNVPLKVFDYLAAGRAILATDIEAHRAILTDDLALMVEPDAPGLCRGLGELLDSRDVRRTLARAARRYADLHLSWESFVTSVARVYRDVGLLPRVPVPPATTPGGSSAS